ncbi:Ketopantoate hydroxymethyltransferase [Desulfotomaculum arcticum]|uniref:3-methyl-2-oxobutanoate hydroxymethyltransferase n=1 Tax=Desulfotruncus arcticus DSM 17038 TaxID=1121424 RepID=A0A1I2XBT0_9FIRM|nr:Ketopantoate hydroxymethyltransferase [Desulfotomaculum arcticum] [Desulfotruncus arcticus DSM 17038]
MSKKSINDFQNRAEKGEKIVYLTAYDYLTAKMQEKAGVNMILVGDSPGMVMLGYNTPSPLLWMTWCVTARQCAVVQWF